ncbi:riboflavin kinase/ FMN adenyltransferase [Leifsonia xyli subsp. cynodontis DSM 46306]|uniref:Uncharacterized protein n=1 Tax=Leifsonia xyli subsp. cynodontis DSM 46306 TaxID=1389489 RepID=U3P427_LEIXC|nr:riboflavin kinase/ FMN adenyltransferase [Leifsonia xyli subsp. cynodontis DSM 46306]
MVHDRHAELHLLLLAAGELVEPDFLLLADADALQVLARPAAGGLPAESLEPAEVDHDVDHGLLLVEAAFFGEVAQPLARLGAERLAVDVEDARGRLVDAEQCADGGRLA